MTELEKYTHNFESIRIINEFLEYVESGGRNISLGKWIEEDSERVAHIASLSNKEKEKVVLGMFDINPEELEKERANLLKGIQAKG